MKLLTNKTLKTFLSLLISLFLIEMLFKIGQGYQLIDWSTLRILIGCTLVSSLFAFILSFIKNKIANNIIMFIIIIFVSIYAIAQASFNNYLGTYMSFATATQAQAIGQFVGEFISNIKIVYWIMLIPVIALIVLYIIFDKKIDKYEEEKKEEKLNSIKGKNKKEEFLVEYDMKKKKSLFRNRLVFFSSFILSIIIYFVTLILPFMQNDLQMVSNMELFNNPSMPNIAISQFGVGPFSLLDVKALIFNHKEEVVTYQKKEEEVVVKKNYERKIDDTAWIELNNTETISDYKTLNNYFMSKNITPKNDYTGTFKGKNLIVIMIESGSNVLFDYPEYFPNINKIYNEGITFTNAFSPRNACSTGNNEMSGITSLYTINRNCTANVYKDNIYHTALFNLFNNEGYYTSSYHDYTDHFYYRHDYHPNMGSQKFMGVNELNIKLGSGYQPWPSDVEFVEKAIPNFVDQEHFMAWLTTVSSHMTYLNSSVTGDANLSMFKDEKWDISAKRYMSKLVYVDQFFGRLLELLEENNVLDDTVLMIYADHEPYGLNQDVFQSLAKYSVAKYGDVDRTPFIIYNSKVSPTKIEKYTSFINILPTIANLFDLDYDPRLYGGHDLFDENYENYVVFADGSWRSDIAYYDATSGKISYFTDETYDANEIKRINNNIKNEMSMNNLAIKRDYFNYLNKKLNIGFVPGKVNNYKEVVKKNTKK